MKMDPETWQKIAILVMRPFFGNFGGMNVKNMAMVRMMYNLGSHRNLQKIPNFHRHLFFSSIPNFHQASTQRHIGNPPSPTEGFPAAYPFELPTPDFRIGQAPSLMPCTGREYMFFSFYEVLHELSVLYLVSKLHSL